MVDSLDGLSTFDLLTLWSGTAAELKRRGVVRTSNIVGDLAEAVASEHFGGVRASFSEPSWDVLAPDGERIQVKALWRTRPSRNKLSAIRDSDYDSVVAIVFDTGFGLIGSYQVSRASVEEMFLVAPRVNGRQITVTQKFVNDPRVQELDMSAAYHRVVTTASPAAQINPTSRDVVEGANSGNGAPN